MLKRKTFLKTKRKFLATSQARLARLKRIKQRKAIIASRNALRFIVQDEF